MPRTKNYNETEVIEKAMNLFWRNGYETTSMQMLEKEMGINKFSIYASFGNKNGVFLESIKCYKQKLNKLIAKLEQSTKGVKAIKTYFYDFIEFSKETEYGKGCLITNTANELSPDADEKIKEVLSSFTNVVRNVFVNTLKQEKHLNQTLLEEQADYLIVAMFGLSSASRVFNSTQLENYIENIFNNI
ncbi:TetR/AcrR family transcriptional regulator [Neotamlana laminarinivorans]|uniref:TetR/AcrR family transcriptional regulator n=1 Tax=Neotamlana laminarinivorans TaxID=2883124 RepID=A0A9X1HXM4_9FLAO|nr:TetR/AcrR family transcriptional regulator [Tamlana laminarinivorans]MCB4798034.1 TetR/AcrR family transcriptional regulator [Tamlana laminarinivorans]